jgi:Arc/MetJ family transcription regulator
MRTNIEIDDLLMRKAMQASAASTKKATVEKALKLLIRLHDQGKIRELRGKVHWEGDLEAMRLDESPTSGYSRSAEMVLGKSAEVLSRPAAPRGEEQGRDSSSSEASRHGHR